jgi:hypothetical protein
MKLFPENEARGSLIVVAVFIVLDIISATLAGPDGAETPLWVWELSGLIPVYGIVLGMRAVWHKNYLGLLGIILNILIIFFLIFAVAWDSWL